MAATREWLTTREVAERLGIGPSTLRRWVRQGIFPNPSRLNQRVHRWRRRIVQEWFDQRQAID
jgi:predicted DNA-binding transcriptional regulator AlpA